MEPAPSAPPHTPPTDKPVAQGRHGFHRIAQVLAHCPASAATYGSDREVRLLTPCGPPARRLIV